MTPIHLTQRPASRRLARTAAALLAASLLPLAALAQPATGTVEGRVLNAANGQYLGKAVVTVAGTNLSSLTNDFGEFVLRNVPAGSATLRVSYLGLPSESVEVTVGAGVTVREEILLNGTADRGRGAVVLDKFVVESDRFKTATDIAINEERHSVNIKNVVAADAFGDIPSGNVGEFIKFLPGVELEYGGTYIAPTDAFGVSVRGFGAADTAIYIDGVPVASASQASLTTQVGLDMLSINNASRIELVKVPTPDMPMNSVGGQINLISKSAFEHARPSLSWRAYVTINSEHPNPFDRVAGPKPKKVYAGSPGFELSYIKPVNDRFGLTLTASSFSQFSENRRFRPQWGTSNVRADLRPFGGSNGTTITNAEGPVSLANPYLERISITDAPRTNRSYTASLKADWKPLDGLAVTGSYQISTYEAADSARRIQIRSRTPMSWDATHMISYPYVQSADSANGRSFNPRSSLEMNIDSRDKEGITHTGSLRATYRKGPWDIFALASASSSRASFEDFGNGHFSTVDVEASIGQVKFENIVDGIPRSVTVLDRHGRPFDFTDLSNWRTPEIRGRSGLAESLDDVFNYKFDVKRELDFLPWDSVRLAVKTGYLREETLKKKWGRGTGYRETYTGPDLSVDDYLDRTYIGQDPGFGFAPQEWISTYRLYDIYAANPGAFTITDRDARENWFSFVGQNKRIKEVKDAWYAQLEGSTLKNRLHFVAGLRQESAQRTGFGPRGDGRWHLLKNPDGTLYRNPDLLGGRGTVRVDRDNSPLFAGDATGTALRADLTAKGVAFPTSAIDRNTLEGAMRERQALQPVDGESKGKPSYSVNLSYDFTEKLVGKLAWSRTFGRIPIESARAGLLSGNHNDFRITEDEDPTAFPAGTISVANPNLLPEISDNWDFALTYYTDHGGKLGASYYTKDIKNFSDDLIAMSGSPEFAEILDGIGLDPAEYADWRVVTSVNGLGTGKVSGYELEAFQDLRFLPWLGDWGRRVQLFATYSHTKRSEDNTTRISARPASSRLATGGLNVSARRLTLNVKATWRDVTFLSGAGNFNVDGRTIQLGTYEPSGTKVDASLNFQLTPRYSLYVSGRNILETGLRRDRFDLAGVYPAYAHWDDLREFGVQWTFGVKGSF